jgi:outer membrane protein
MTSISKIALACAALVAASGAFAQKAGDNIVSIGLASINPDVSLGTLNNSTSSAALGHPGTTVGGLLAGTTAKVSNETTISLGLLHMYTDNVGAEFTIGIPPTVTQDLNTPVLSSTHPAAAKIDVWTPTVVAKYFFGTSQDSWRPYVGLGVSRVSFHNIVMSSDSTVQALAGTSASLSSSWTRVYNAGVIYNIDEKWSISGSVSYLPIKTNATFVGANAGSTTGEVKLNTTDYVVKMGYRF